MRKTFAGVTNNALRSENFLIWEGRSVEM